MVRSLFILGVFVSQALGVRAQECLSDAAALFQRTDKVNFQKSTALMAQTRGSRELCKDLCKVNKCQGCDGNKKCNCGEFCDQNRDPDDETMCKSCNDLCKESKPGFEEGCGGCTKSCKEKGFDPTTCTGGPGASCFERCKENECTSKAKCPTFCDEGGDPDNTTQCPGGGGGSGGGGGTGCSKTCQENKCAKYCPCFCKGGGNPVTCEIGGVYSIGDGERYTPSQAKLGLSRRRSKKVKKHGVPQKWATLAPWDRDIDEPFDPQLPKDELADAICPTTKKNNKGEQMLLGLRKLYEDRQPFSNPKKPTWAEIDAWHAHSLVHIRELVGSNHPVVKDHCLFVKAFWGNQRQLTTDWDEKYNASDWSECAGPCYLSQGEWADDEPGNEDGDKTGKSKECAGHCGTKFLPDEGDQEQYLNRNLLPNGTCTSDCQSSEGILYYDQNAPWATKWVLPFCKSLRNKGMTGHTGPFFGRSNFGWSFYRGQLRAKWGGESCNPSKIANCR